MERTFAIPRDFKYPSSICWLEGGPDPPGHSGSLEGVSSLALGRLLCGQVAPRASWGGAAGGLPRRKAPHSPATSPLATETSSGS